MKAEPKAIWTAQRAVMVTQTVLQGSPDASRTVWAQREPLKNETMGQ